MTTLLAQSKANDALFDAATGGKVRDVKAALKAGADVNTWDEDGSTALMWAARFNANANNANVVRALIDAGADVDARDKHDLTVLMYAAAYNENFDVLNVLIDAGADVNAQDSDGSRAIDFLEVRPDESEFSKTVSYQQMRDLLYVLTEGGLL